MELMSDSVLALFASSTLAATSSAVLFADFLAVFSWASLAFLAFASLALAVLALALSAFDWVLLELLAGCGGLLAAVSVLVIASAPASASVFWTVVPFATIWPSPLVVSSALAWSGWLLFGPDASGAAIATLVTGALVRSITGVDIGASTSASSMAVSISSDAFSVCLGLLPPFSSSVASVRRLQIRDRVEGDSSGPRGILISGG
ncbi:uncharacterized protein N7482_010775 [Penicillium canariense]|uniref:Uncharacterized protein n=1 Tax=Penicillium canariense TaxID=189055 RepID=A0A9W9LEL1_9EURO|nr:uncharacterized protein N7482_010775 [Penicillium canariense]KAJ5151523.1 hypothetical protein N7482_010775 [Penicillium canariense]